MIKCFVVSCFDEAHVVSSGIKKIILAAIWEKLD